MNRKNIFLGFVAVVFLVQWLVPLSMIFSREGILAEGNEVKVWAQPVDPYDPFRGRYVVINAAPEISGTVVFPSDARYGQEVYAVLETDDDGFARVTGILLEPPGEGLYLKAEYHSGTRRTLGFELDRYYMNEKLAPAAEQLVRSRLFENESDVYITVKVRNGESVITGLFIDGTPIEELLLRDE